MATDLVAKADNDLLSVKGATAGGRMLVANLTIYDSDGTVVDIQGDTSNLHRADFRRVTGGGVELYSVSLYETVWGTRSEDLLRLHGGNETLSGMAGDDWIEANDGRDELHGGKGVDSLDGGSGLDRLYGERGDDFLNGGYGTDVAYYAGNVADYDVALQDGIYVVTDLRGGSPQGTDKIGNVERLRFADGVLDLAPHPTQITAVVQGDTLVVGGEAQRPDGGERVSILLGSYDQVIDNDEIGVLVPVDGEWDDVVHVDARGLRGTGVNVLGDALDNLVHGSRGADFVIAGQDGDDTLYGFKGVDRITGGDGNDALYGGNGDDSLYGYSDDDALRGQTGDDLMDGDDGFDVAIYSGNRDDYFVGQSGSGWLVFDERAGSPDGSDSLYEVERIRFADGFLDLAPPPQSPVTLHVPWDGSL